MEKGRISNIFAFGLFKYVNGPDKKYFHLFHEMCACLYLLCAEAGEGEVGVCERGAELMFASPGV